MHSAFERFWPNLYRAEAMSLVIVMAFAEWVPRTALGLHIVLLLAVLVVRLNGPTGCGPISVLMMKLSLSLELPGRPFVPWPWNGRGPI
jgi:hypothetical protein